MQFFPQFKKPKGDKKSREFLFSMARSNLSGFHLSTTPGLFFATSEVVRVYPAFLGKVPTATPVHPRAQQLIFEFPLSLLWGKFMPVFSISTKRKYLH